MRNYFWFTVSLGHLAGHVSADAAVAGLFQVETAVQQIAPPQLRIVRVPRAELVVFAVNVLIQPAEVLAGRETLGGAVGEHLVQEDAHASAITIAQLFHCIKMSN
jgi:membrane associated rhomboid family serine protease